MCRDETTPTPWTKQLRGGVDVSRRNKSVSVDETFAAKQLRLRGRNFRPRRYRRMGRHFRDIPVQEMTAYLGILGVWIEAQRRIVGQQVHDDVGLASTGGFREPRLLACIQRVRVRGFLLQEAANLGGRRPWTRTRWVRRSSGNMDRDVRRRTSRRSGVMIGSDRWLG